MTPSAPETHGSSETITAHPLGKAKRSSPAAAVSTGRGTRPSVRSDAVLAHKKVEVLVTFRRSARSVMLCSEMGFDHAMPLQREPARSARPLVAYAGDSGVAA